MLSLEVAVVTDPLSDLTEDTPLITPLLPLLAPGQVPPESDYGGVRGSQLFLCWTGT